MTHLKNSAFLSFCFLLAACASTPATFKDSDRQPLYNVACAVQPRKGLYIQQRCTGVAELDTHKEGLWCCFDPNGALLMGSQFHDGLKNGRTELYSAADGHLESVSTWKDGELEGPQINFFPNGGVANEYLLENGKFSGEMRDYDETGRLRSVGHYKDGKRHGSYKEWDANGALVTEEKDK